MDSVSESSWPCALLALAYASTMIESSRFIMSSITKKTYVQKKKPTNAERRRSSTKRSSQ